MSIDVSPRLAGLEIKGTPFEIGFALGRQGAKIVHSHLLRTHAWAVVMGFRDKPPVCAARTLVERHFPRYFEELRGLAEGLDLPFDEVFAWNCRGDLGIVSPDGCTTVQLPGAFPVIAHNEDGDPGLRPGCALATVQPNSGRRFTSFVYPASIPGHTFSVNDAGLVIAVNNIRSQEIGDGLPRMVLTRALLDCGTRGEAVELLKSKPRAGAFHLTLARAGEKGIFSVEFTHRHVSVVPVLAPSSHANHLVHDDMRNERQIVTASSRSRQERGDEIIAAERGGTVDPLAILRDTERGALPIFRAQPDDPDNENTLATAYFQIGADKVDCTVYDRSDTPPSFRCSYGPLEPH